MVEILIMDDHRSFREVIKECLRGECGVNPWFSIINES